MANDMTGTFIAFDELSTLKPEPDFLKFIDSGKEKSKIDAFIFPEPKKYTTWKNIAEETYTFTNIDLASAPEPIISKASIKRAMEQMIQDQMNAIMYHQQREMEVRRCRPQKLVSEILQTPDDWCQRTMHKYDGFKTRRCLVYAIMVKWGMHDQNFPHGNYSRDIEAVARVIYRKYPSHAMRNSIEGFVASWNDNPARSFNEVREVILEAGI